MCEDVPRTRGPARLRLVFLVVLEGHGGWETLTVRKKKPLSQRRNGIFSFLEEMSSYILFLLSTKCVAQREATLIAKYFVASSYEKSNLDPPPSPQREKLFFPSVLIVV